MVENRWQGTDYIYTAWITERSVRDKNSKGKREMRRDRCAHGIQSKSSLKFFHSSESEL